MHSVEAWPLGRLLPLALCGLFVASACTTASADVAAAPVALLEPQTREQRAEAPTQANTAVVTPGPTAVAAVATPRPTPAAAATPVVTKAATKLSTGRAHPRSAEADANVVRLRPRPKAGPFEMNLFTVGDFMHQATKDMCVAGSTQIMMNVIDSGRPNRSVAYQERLYERGRQLSPNKAKLGPIGVDLTGWAELLNTNGYGPYVVESAETRRGAIRKAARAIRLTGRPVGLVVWRGAHSWVMSGFTATADPAYDDGFQVKAAYIQDTWYPYVSTIWGASNPPNTLVPVGKLQEDYLPYQRPRARYPKRDGKFMVILPVLPKGTIAR